MTTYDVIKLKHKQMSINANTAVHTASQAEKSKRTVPAENFMQTLEANVDNEKLSDENFRQFVRNSIDIVKNGGDILQDYIEYRQLDEDLKEFIRMLTKIKGI